MTTYLLYAKAGKEMQVADDLRLLGIDTWCGRVIHWERRGKKRQAEPREEPMLPNYIFADMAPYDYHRAMGVRHLHPTATIIGHKESLIVRKFQNEVDAAYKEQAAIRAKAETPLSEYDPQAPLRIIAGPFADKIVKFRRFVDAHDPLAVRIEADGPMGVMKLDPLDVRAAE